MASLPMIASGGGSGSELKISVFYTEEFYGETISCSKGSTTLTETATSSGEVEFTVTDEGIWTISCTVDGNLYETEVTVYYDYPATLLAVPEGSTATPTDDIQLWLKCADIRHLNYTTLGQVLGDEFTLDTLLRDSNACDYMARSTTWASSVAGNQSAMELIGMYDYCAKALLDNSTWASAIGNSTYWGYVLQSLVPVMTGYNTPSGKVTYSQATSYSSYPLWQAFDNNVNTYGVFEQTNYASNYLGYVFTSSVKIKKAVIKIADSQESRISRLKVVCASAEGGTWVSASDWVTPIANTEIVVSSNLDYPYWAIYFDRAATSPVEFAEIQFYGRASTTEYEPLIPIMTSNTSPSGVCSASSSASGCEAYKAMDNDTNTYWQNVPESTDYLQYEFASPVVGKKMFLEEVSGYQTPPTKLIASNDALTWTDIATIPSGGATYSIYFLDNETAYKYWRVTFSNPNRYTTRVHTFQLYAEADAPNGLIHSAANDTIYYLDNEGNETVLATTNAKGVGEVDWSLLDTGNYTLYSTVAKNPANLTDDYGKTVKVTSTPKGSTTELYVLPKHTLYWYGYIGDNCEEIRPTHGWTIHSGYTWEYPTYNTYDIYLDSSGSVKLTGIGTKYEVVSNKMNVISEGYHVIGGYTPNYAETIACSSKIMDSYSVNFTELVDKKLYSQAYTTTNAYLATSTMNGGIIKLFAFWSDKETDAGNFISAPYDEVYFYLNGEKIIFAVTDGNGYASLDYSRIPSGYYTLYSSVAKLPNDLSSPYFKRVEITENTTEISLMPDNVLYWYGYESANLEDCTSTNGWSFSNYTLVAPTHNIASINMSGAAGRLSGVASKSKVNGTNAYAIATGVRTFSGYGYLNAENSKAMAFNSQTIMTSSSMTKYSVALNNQYVCVEVDGAREINLHAMWYDTTPSTTPTMYSAAEDTLYIYDANNNVVPIATTNSEGKYYGEIPLAEGTYTIYSSVAKDPENLSQPYSKSITITSQTTSISMMPENALYWYGYMSSNCEEMSTANGWTNESGYTFVTPTYNTNSVTITGDGNISVGIASKNAITATTLKTIATPKQQSGSWTGFLTKVSSKALPSEVTGDHIVGTVNTMALFTSSVSGSNFYPILYTRHTRSFDAHALWYE